MKLKSRAEHRGLGTDSIQITCEVSSFFLYYMIFSYIFDPLLAVIATQHIVNLHFPSGPLIIVCVCVCGCAGRVCVYIYARSLGRRWRGGAVVLDLAEAAQFV